MNISTDIFNQHQSWYIVAVDREGEHTLRYTIKRNAYDEQSHCHVERFDGAKWHVVISLPPAVVDPALLGVSYVLPLDRVAGALAGGLVLPRRRARRLLGLPEGE